MIRDRVRGIRSRYGLDNAYSEHAPAENMPAQIAATQPFLFQM